jgi:hypothetical protein
MSENLAVRAKKKTVSAYLALAVIFIVIFGSIAAIRISSLN